MDRIKSEGYSFFFESIYKISQVTDKLCEIPIIFEERRYGTSKISKSEIVKAMANLVGLFVRRAYSRKKAVVQKVEALENQMDCPNCQQPFNVEIYPEKFALAENNVYNCTSNHHSSHGRVVQCLTCALTYTNPQPPPETILEMYSDVEDRQYIENFSSRVETFDYNFSKVKRFFPSAGRLLDVGSYCGVFLSVAKGKGYKVSGIEPSKWDSKYANETIGVDTFTGTIQYLPEEIAGFDIVTFWDVLGHCPDPLSELRNINQ